MSGECQMIHGLINDLEIHQFPFKPENIPSNGIYFLYEENELGHDVRRIVRVGTHRGDNQLSSRLTQHFLNENKDRSIFRKNVGRALLHQRNDDFLQHWNLDLTAAANRIQYEGQIDFDYQQKVEKAVTNIIQNSFCFSVISVDSQQERLDLESKLIATIAQCKDCRPSDDWFGMNSPVRKIVESGLWQVQHLNSAPFNQDELERFETVVLR